MLLSVGILAPLLNLWYVFLWQSQELENLDADALAQKEVEEFEREKKELANRWRVLEKKVCTLQSGFCMQFSTLH